ncbi:MAG: tRNA uridine-5-carboxymethylaminomethyl(34) synthesis GTPase MnmE [Rhodothermaceae bacterium]
MYSINDDTITALATASGAGAISVIRMSGKESFSIVDQIFKGAKKISECKTHTINYGRILDSESNTIDDVLVSVFKNPYSYTGEDSVEVSTHGSQIVIKKIISLLTSAGARLAEPGEFTKRAFLNGKIDLAQAEAVADVINARTEASLKGARNQLDGLLSQKIETLRTELVNSSSLIELELDFAEEDLEFLPSEKMISRIDEIVKEISTLLDTYNFGRIIRDGVNVALAGHTNVGKSSLLNYILKESRAIVSPIPGTTRDVIREDVSIDGILYRFYDTAGIRFTEDIVEREGVKRSRRSIEDADIILFIYDVVNGIDKKLLEEVYSLTEKDRVMIVANKSDLSDVKEKEDEIFISAKTGEGVDKLFEELNKKNLHTKTYSESSAVVSNIRHYAALQKAKEHLLKAKESLNMNMTGEFVSVDLRSSIDSLGEIIGTVTTDDILNNIFDNFCIGK